MEILIRLKDCNLIKISSYLETDTVYDYYGDYQVPIQYMSFYFSDHSILPIIIKDDAYADFCTIASFFYGKNFLCITKDEFITALQKELGAEINRYGKTRW